MGLPARGYSWPQFEPGNTVGRQFEKGNTAAARHGAWSRRMVEPVANELAGVLLADRPELVAYPEAVAAWARAEARCLLFAERLAQVKLVDDDGEPAPALKHVATFERLAADLRARLGLDPRAEAELRKAQGEAVAQAFDLEALRAKGREIIERRRAAGDFDQVAEAVDGAPCEAGAVSSSMRDAGVGPAVDDPASDVDGVDA